MEKPKEFRSFGMSFGVLGRICFNPWVDLIGEKLSLIHILLNLDNDVIEDIYEKYK